MSILKRTPKNGVIAVVTVYAVILLSLMAFSHALPSKAAMIVCILPALLGGLLASGYLVVISGANGIRFVDPGRTPSQMEQARRDLAAEPAFNDDGAPKVNIDGTPMAGGGVDIKGNPYGIVDMNG